VRADERLFGVETGHGVEQIALEHLARRREELREVPAVGQMQRTLRSTSLAERALTSCLQHGGAWRQTPQRNGEPSSSNRDPPALGTQARPVSGLRC